MTVLIYQQLYGEYNAQKIQMFVLNPNYKSLQFPTFLRVHPPSSFSRKMSLSAGAARRRLAEKLPTFGCAGVTLADTGSGRWECWQLKGPIIHKKWIVITSIPGQYIDDAFANHG